MILFLDFDGVLHPDTIEDASDLFCCRRHLWTMLDEAQLLEVVLSTSWRFKHSLDDMVAQVTAGGGEHHAPRFIGATPKLEVENEKSDLYRSREKECLAWLQASGEPSREWIALDDVAYLFSFPQPRLVLVNHETGLTETDVAQIARIANGSD